MKGENKTALGILLLGGVGIGGYFLWKYLKGGPDITNPDGFVAIKRWYEQDGEAVANPIAGREFDVVIVAGNKGKETVEGYLDITECRTEGENCNAVNLFCCPSFHCIDVGLPDEGGCISKSFLCSTDNDCFTGYSCIDGVCTIDASPTPVFSETAIVESRVLKTFVYKSIMPDTFLDLIIETGRIINSEKVRDSTWALSIMPTIPPVIPPQVEISNLQVSFPPF